MGSLEDKLQSLKEDITDNLNDVSEFISVHATKFKNELSDNEENAFLSIPVIIGIFSKMAKQLTILLLQAKKSENMTEEDKINFQLINKFAQELGNLQFDLIEIKKAKKRKKSPQIINDKIMEFSKNLSKLEARLQGVRGSVNSIRFEEGNPLAMSVTKESI